MHCSWASVVECGLCSVFACKGLVPLGHLMCYCVCMHLGPAKQGLDSARLAATGVIEIGVHCLETQVLCCPA